MVPGNAQAVMLAGIVIGLTLLGGIIGAGIDFVSGNLGWWGVGGLIGLMTGVILVAMLVESRNRAATARNTG